VGRRAGVCAVAVVTLSGGSLVRSEKDFPASATRWEFADGGSEPGYEDIAGIAAMRFCISSGLTSSMCVPSDHSWPKGSVSVPMRSP